jgi:integrase
MISSSIVVADRRPQAHSHPGHVHRHRSRKPADHRRPRQRRPQLRAAVRGVRTVGPATKHRIRATLRKAVNDAIKIYRLIDYNLAVPIALPSGARPRARAWTVKAFANWEATGETPSPVMVWLPDQAVTFLDHAEERDLICYALYSLITVWGLRRGEACGRRDIDVDLDTGTVTIRQQRVAVAYKPIVRKVKSAAGASS